MDVLGSLKKLFGSGSKGKGPGTSTLAKMPKTDLSKRFDIIGKTGQGSMSKVFKARDLKLGRTVCLKILDKAKTAKFEARFTGLQRPSEGVICMSLRHPNIVVTYEYGMSTQGEPFLVMELIDGEGLNFLIETRSPKLVGERVNYLGQLADGLEYIHQQKYLHRDICPRNIMVTKAGIVKYIDFGLAIPYLPAFCKPGNRTGTPEYLAPEVIKRTSTDHRVDLFALGVTAYELYTYTMPWERGASMQTILSHVNRAGDDPRQHNKKLDEKTAKFLMKSIERDPRDRYQSAAQFKEALQDLPKL